MVGKITQASRRGLPGPSKSSLGKRKSTSSHAHRKKVHYSKKTIKRKGKMRYKPKGLNNLLAISQHNDLSKRWLGSYWPGLFKRKSVKTFGNSYFHDVNNWVAGDKQGKQCVDSLENILTNFMIVGTTSNNRNTRQQLAVALHDFCVTAAQNTGGFPFAAANAVAADKFYVRSVSANVSMLSLENVAQEVLMYFVTPKKDTYLDPVSYFDQICQVHRLGNGAATPAAATTTATATAGGADYTDIGQNPWKYEEFRNVWRCIKAVKIVLQPGDQHSVSASFKYNRPFLLKEFSARSSVYLSGITIVPMVILRGGLVGIALNDASVSSEVANAKTRVGFATNYQYNLAALPVSRFVAEGYFPGNVVDDTTQVMHHINDVDVVSQLATA